MYIDTEGGGAAQMIYDICTSYEKFLMPSQLFSLFTMHSRIKVINYCDNYCEIWKRVLIGEDISYDVLQFI